MVGSSKILTVSYGTFSCTLEGFDDPFTTMKSIAEYFRDLAADDRYFGAEPPTPDAEMLHRIAEREIDRRVESRVEGNAVVLRPVADETEPQEAAGAGLVETGQVAQAAAPVEPDVPPHGDAGIAEKLRRIRAAVARAQDEPPTIGAFAEDEHAQDFAAGATIATAFAGVEDAVVEEEDLADFAAQHGTVARPEPEPAAPADSGGDEAAGEDAPEEEPEVADTDTPEEQEVSGSETGVEDEAAAKVPDTDPVADEAASDGEGGTSLDEAATRIAAAIAAGEAMVDEDELEAEPAGRAEPDPDLAAAFATAEGPADEPQETVAETVADRPQADDAEEPETIDMAPTGPAAEEAASAGDEDAEPLSLATEPEAGDDDLAGEDAGVSDADLDAIRAALAGDADEPAEPEAAQVEDLTGEGDEAEDTTAGFEADEQATDGTDGATEEEFVDLTAVEAATIDEIEETADAEDETGLEAAEDEVEADDAPLQLTAEDSVDDAPRPRARVVKMSRDEFEARFEAAEAEEDDAPDAEPDVEDRVRAGLGETGLSPDDEADLVAELAAAERGDEAPADDAIGEDATSVPGDAADEAAPAAPRLRRRIPEPEPAVERILEQTRTELDSGEGSRRRSAIEHLKAAVAAVRADVRLREGEEPARRGEALNRFREDLAHAVQPDAPAASPDEAEPVAEETAPDGRAPVARPTDEADAATARRVPPLMLVSEQRVDRPETPSAPVQPRRVSAVSENRRGDDRTDGEPGDDESEFDAFVARYDLTELPDLLEASAAFAAFVEGEPFGSRAEIIHRVRMHAGRDAFSREDSLRAFGMLLREGRLVKLRRGVFAVADNTRFQPDNRSAAG